mgnify:CR=1 FL=1
MERFAIDFYQKTLDFILAGIYIYDLRKGNNIYVNQQYSNLTGYSLGELNQMSQEEFFSLFHPEDQAAVAQHMEDVLKNQPGTFLEIEYRFKKANGTWMWCRSRDGVFEVGDDLKASQFIGSFVDITSRKEAEQELFDLNRMLEEKVKERTNELNIQLDQKRILLQELHHRVKNNLQVISSLLNLQSNHLKNADPSQVLKEAQNRVLSMALVHEQLYQSEALQRVNFSDYIQKLVENLVKSFRGATNEIAFDIKKNNCCLNIKTLIPIGLILTEIITNSLKHGFMQGQCSDCKIYISLSKDENNKMTLKVGDNGVGIKQFQPPEEAGGLGFKLIDSLTQQINGKLKLDSNSKGTHFQIVFEEESKAEKLVTI